MGKRISSKNIKTVAIFETVYSLFLYLLTIDEKGLNSTFFFFGNGIPKSVAETLPNYKYVHNQCNNFFKRKWSIFKFLWTINKTYPFINNAKIIGQDHLWFVPIILKDKSMITIEDGLANYNPSNYVNKLHSFKEKLRILIQQLLFSVKPLDKIYGASDRIDKVILTNLASIPAELKEKSILINPSYLWEGASEAYRTLLLNIFNVKYEDLKILQQKKILILTQPYHRAGILSEQEQVEIWKNIISKFDDKDIVLKSHPTDNIDYKQYFKDILIFEKPIPMELFSMLGIKFEKAYSISTTALFSLPIETEKIFLGHSCHPKLLNHYGTEINFKELIGNRKGNFSYPSV